jgi:thiamine pyrophosphate-dependent acetolactate synthase large subunit-like protein
VLDRPEALRLIDAAFSTQPIVLTLGGTIREMLAVVGRKPNHLYCLDSMGQPLAIGLGLAVGLADRPHGERVVIVEGDGSLLMGFSSLTTVGHLKPRNLVCVVLDNGVYLATGGQPTAARDTNFSAVARACGWANGRDVESTPEALREALAATLASDGPHLLRVHVTTVQPKTDFFLEDPVILARTFEDWLHSP